MENNIDNEKYIISSWIRLEDYWKLLCLWLKSHLIALTSEVKALNLATKISQSYFPDEKQSPKKLREQAIEEGFPKQY